MNFLESTLKEFNWKSKKGVRNSDGEMDNEEKSFSV